MLSHIKPLVGDDCMQAVEMIGRIKENDGFDNFTFDKDSTLSTIRAHIHNKDSLCIGYFGDNHILEGLSVFTIIPSLFDYSDKKLVELVWHADPVIESKIKKGKIMVTLFNYAMSYFKNQVRHIYISIPLDKKINNFLLRKGFEMSDEKIYQKGVM